jgi:cytochrome c556
MTSRSLSAEIVLVSMTGLVLGGCATGGPKTATEQTTTEQVVTERQRLMKQQGASMQILLVKVKAGNLDAVPMYVETLVVTSRQILQLFPEGSLSDKSRAKPAIWEKWSEFEGYASSLRTQAMKVADLARRKDKAGAEAAVAEMGRTTCVACHDAFRGPPHRT